MEDRLGCKFCRNNQKNKNNPIMYTCTLGQLAFSCINHEVIVAGWLIFERTKDIWVVGRMTSGERELWLSLSFLAQDRE